MGWETFIWSGISPKRHTSKPIYSTAANSRSVRVYERGLTFQCFQNYLTNPQSVAPKTGLESLK